MERVVSDIDILRRVAERGLKQAQAEVPWTVDIWQHMLDEIERLRARVTELEADAERYGHLRDNCHQDDDGDGWLFFRFDCIEYRKDPHNPCILRAFRYNDLTANERKEKLDAALDAARGKGMCTDNDITRSS
jgi:hypothetical protein